MASGAESGAQGASSDETGSSLRAQRTERAGRSVAVTGASTFLGKRLVGLLEEDPAVRRIVVLDVKGSSAAGPKTVYYEVDLTQPGVESRLSEILHAENVDTLAHLAFAASPTQATAWAHELESVGTMNVLAACRRKPGRVWRTGRAQDPRAPAFAETALRHPRTLRGYSPLQPAF